MRRMHCLSLLLCSVLAIAVFECTFCEAFHPQACRRPHISRLRIIEMVASSDNVSYFTPSVVLSPAGADIGMAAAEAEAAKHKWDVTICIVDAGGVPIQVKRNNAFPASYDIAVGKAKSAALFQKETGLLEDAINVVAGKETSRTSLLSSPFVLMRGGVPLLLLDGCAGAVGVSGVQADQDERVARVAVDAMRKLFSNNNRMAGDSNQIGAKL
eukprot:CAMPEP_0119003624 /NCGR_PEP_ID=MMETSP1176-20130426/676_1 /TAXON_ID=265551 /ORGANISM="Synedropsis recta cf, Strain CCMP1620" /LENGTH=212 /DNA_ID=CAMNT_0006955241 /DNA_START=1 /DNA_END=639 /DNA_ORIENTATION=+